MHELWIKVNQVTCNIDAGNSNDVTFRDDPENPEHEGGDELQADEDHPSMVGDSPTRNPEPQTTEGILPVSVTQGLMSEQLAALMSLMKPTMEGVMRNTGDSQHSMA